MRHGLMEYEGCKDRSDKMEEACGVFGVFAPDQDVSRLAYYGLYALQHRGQESAGIAVSHGGTLNTVKGMGLVSEVFDEESLNRLQGEAAIGHVRYSTSGDSSVINSQPLTVKCRLGQLSLSHNGNLANAAKLRKELEEQGTIFQTSTDSEILAHLLAKSREDGLENAMEDVASIMRGAYSFLILTENKLLGLRDPHGFRPLSLGKLPDGYVLASETCAFDTVDAEFVRDVKPGELVIIDEEGVHSRQIMEEEARALCIFEYVYFARPDSNLNNRNVHLVRKEMGKAVSQALSAPADLVSGVPDSSLSAAAGVSEALQVPYEMALIKNRYVGRTFIKPSQALRDMSVKLKLNPVDKIVDGKRLILVDDSIVRGTTINKINKMLKDAGAKEIHVLISSPPVKYPCYYGIDTSTKEELIANRQSVEEIREQIGADSLHFLSVEGMLKAVDQVSPITCQEGFCMSCFNGSQPIGEVDTDES